VCGVHVAMRGPDPSFLLISFVINRPNAGHPDVARQTDRQTTGTAAALLIPIVGEGHLTTEQAFRFSFSVSYELISNNRCGSFMML